MKLTEWLDTVDATLSIKYYPNQERRFSCAIEHGEIKEGIMLVGAHENGKSPREATAAYFKKCAGQRLIINANTQFRREYVIPKNLEIDL